MFNTLVVKSSHKISDHIAKKYNINTNKCHIESICSVEYIDTEMPIYSQGAIIILTSKHAVFAAEKLPKNTRFLVVGKMIEKELKMLQYLNVKTYKNIENLILDIDKNCKYIYLRGEEISTEIYEYLPKLREYIVYKINYFTILHQSAVDIINSGKLERIFLFSYITTLRFLDIINQCNLLPRLININIFTISPKAFEYLIELGFDCTLIDYEY